MRKITPEEFFEHVDIMIDEDNGTIVLESNYGIVADVDSFSVKTSKSIVFHTDERIFLNPSVIGCKSVSELSDYVNKQYQKNQQLEEDRSVAIIKEKEQHDCKCSSNN